MHVAFATPKKGLNMRLARREEINDLADLIRTASKVELPATEADLARLISRLGGSYEILPNLDYEAKIEKTGDNSFTITLSDNFMPTRRKFSLAHELGHLFLHMGFIVDECAWNNTRTFQESSRYRLGRSEEELEANEFAAALLMPKHVFRQVAEDNCQDGSYRVDNIAKHFDVSLQAALTRGRWLGLFPWE